MSKYKDGTDWDGFHGDQNLISFVDYLAPMTDAFIETGSNEGVTLSYFSKKYNKPSFSCEPRLKSFERARSKIEKLNHVRLFNKKSLDMLKRIEGNFSYLYEKNCLFWIDSHGFGFDWPLLDEIKIITSSFSKGFLLIDDFKVPDKPCFGFDSYHKQTCSFDYIKDSIKKPFSLFYPSYTNKTSKHHPLRGWGLLSFGENSGLEINHKFCEKHIETSTKTTTI